MQEKELRINEDIINYLVDKKVIPVWKENVKGKVVLIKTDKKNRAFNRKKGYELLSQLKIDSREECDQLRNLIWLKLLKK